MAQRSSPHPTQPVDAEQVRAVTVRQLIEVLPLGVAGYAYSDTDIYTLLVAAAAERRSLESVSHQFARAPSANLVRHYLDDRLLWALTIDELEERMNTLLTACLPPGLVGRRVRLAVDVTLLPYYGSYADEPGEIRRGEAKAGTTRFHAYASANVIRRERRVSLAVAFVQAEDALVDVLDELLARIQALGIGIRRLYLDREFASVVVLRRLADQPFTSIVALPKRGGRLRALLHGRQGSRASYTMSSADEGELTFPLWIAVRSAMGQRGRQGQEYLPFAVVGQPHCELTVRQVAEEYRERLGIEASYRLMHQGLARTTSRDPGLRLLLVTIGLLLTNLWVWLKAVLLAHTRRGERALARVWLEQEFRLDGFRDLLIEAIRARYQVHTALRYPFPLAASFTLCEAQIGKY
jgi:putative transposase